MVADATTTAASAVNKDAAEKVLAKKSDEAVQQTLFKASLGEVKSRLN